MMHSRNVRRWVLIAGLLVCVAVGSNIACSRLSRAAPFELIRVASPNSEFIAAVVVQKEYKLWLPDPEPPKAKVHYHRLRVLQGRKALFDGARGQLLGEFPHPEFALDLLWSPDSQAIAYRQINELVLIRPSENPTQRFSVGSPNSQIASFKWLSPNKIIVLAKRMDTPLGLYGYPHFHSYINKSSSVELYELDVQNRKASAIFKGETKPTTFIFRGAGFRMDELSRFSDRLAFTDGANICVYDYAKKQMILRRPVRGVAEGIWWADADTVIIGVDTLSGDDRFMRLRVTDAVLTDVTSVLMAHWDQVYGDHMWFAEGLKEHAP